MEVGLFLRLCSLRKAIMEKNELLGRVCLQD